MKKENKSIKKNDVFRVAFAVLSFLAGIIGSVVFKNVYGKVTMFENGGLLENLLIFYVYIFMAFLINIVIHEGGHLVFGLLSGYRFLSFRVFNVMLVKTNGRYKITKSSVPGTGGQCLLAPPAYSENFPYLLYNLGGIIFGGIFGGVCLWGAFVTERSVSEIFFVTGFIAIINVILNGIPFTKGIQNDAKNIMDLRNMEENRRGLYLQLKVEEALYNNLWFTDMPEEWFSYEIPFEDNNFGMANEMLKCAYIFAEKDFEAAEKKNDALREMEMLPLYKNLLLIDKIYMMLLKNEDPEHIKILMTKEFRKILKALPYENSALRTSYAIEKYINMDEKKAANILKRFQKKKEACFKIKEYEFESSLIRMLDEVKREDSRELVS